VKGFGGLGAFLRY